MVSGRTKPIDTATNIGSINFPKNRACSAA